MKKHLLPQQPHQPNNPQPTRNPHGVSTLLHSSLLALNKRKLL